VGISAFYYLNVVRAMFFVSPEEAVDGDGSVSTGGFSVSVSVQIAVIVCVGATLWIGLYPTNVINWANDASRYLLTLSL
jgi:NADH:ubiquinone oxidoreductase subunit 2 (subunit N)